MNLPLRYIDCNFLLFRKLLYFCKDPFSNTPVYPLGHLTDCIIFPGNLCFRKFTTVWTSGSSGIRAIFYMTNK